MLKRMFVNLFLVFAVLLSLGVGVAGAAPPAAEVLAQEEMTYTVKLGDNLWTLAEKYLGSGPAYWAIFYATDAKYEEDSSFAHIENPGLIHPGWKLLIPSAEEAAKYVEGFTPAPVEVLRLQLDEPTSLDPPFYFSGTATGPYVMRHLFDGLTLIDLETGAAEPGVAASWEVSEDGRTWTFYLTEGYMWSDGHEVTAHDFEYAWKRNIDPETGVEALWLLEPIDKAAEILYEGADPDILGIKAVDDYTLEVTTVEPMSYLPSYVSLASFWPLPRWAIEEHGKAWIEAENIVVNGPYLVDKWEHDREMVLVKNPAYSGDPVNIDRVEIKLVAGKPLLAYQEDEIDITSVGIADLPVVQADAALSDQLSHILYKWLFFVALDTRHSPFDDLRVRQALYLALDRETIANDVLRGSKVPAYTFIPEGTLGHNPDARIEGDVETAKQLLVDAGYPDGAGFPKVKLTMSAAEPGSDYYLVTSAMQTMWKDNLGIEVELDMREEAAYWDWAGTTEETEYDMAWSNWAGDIDDPGQWYVAQTGVLYPQTGFSNTEYDDLIRAGATESEPSKRAEIYQEAEVMGVEGVPVIPVYYDSGYWLVKPRVKGMQFEPLWGVMYWRHADIVE